MCNRQKSSTCPVENSGNVKVDGKTLHANEIEIISDLDTYNKNGFLRLYFTSIPATFVSRTK